MAQTAPDVARLTVVTDQPASLRSDRVRLYDSVRSAHLERAHELSPAAIIYNTRRYDFDESLTDGLELIQASPVRAARLIARSSVTAVEINEPLMLSSLPATVLTLAALRLRRARPSVVTYAIENADPFANASTAKARTRVRRALERRAARWVWRRVDRVAYGTEAAQRLYAQRLGPARAASALIHALPSPCDRNDEPDRRPDTALFVGSFAERKGIRVLLDAWPQIRATDSTATLTLIGQGPLTDVVQAFAAADSSVTVIIDPPRTTIHEALATAQTLVLPSQPTRTWREQVGLPIVEGLAHGCTIVTTDQTGLATWLVEHGHHVVSRADDAAELAAAIASSLRARRPAADVLAALPDRDGRLAADDWMFSDLAG